MNTKTYEKVMADLRQVVVEALAREVTVDVPSVLARVRSLHPTMDVPTDVLEARIMYIAQEFNAPMSFGKRDGAA